MVYEPNYENLQESSCSGVVNTASVARFRQSRFFVWRYVRTVYIGTHSRLFCSNCTLIDYISH